MPPLEAEEDDTDKEEEEDDVEEDDDDDDDDDDDEMDLASAAPMPLAALPPLSISRASATMTSPVLGSMRWRGAEQKKLVWRSAQPATSSRAFSTFRPRCLLMWLSC